MNTATCSTPPPHHLLRVSWLGNVSEGPRMCGAQRVCYLICVKIQRRDWVNNTGNWVRIFFLLQAPPRFSFFAFPHHLLHFSLPSLSLQVSHCLFTGSRWTVKSWLRCSRRARSVSRSSATHTRLQCSFSVSRGVSHSSSLPLAPPPLNFACPQQPG